MRVFARKNDGEHSDTGLNTAYTIEQRIERKLREFFRRVAINNTKAARRMFILGEIIRDLVYLYCIQCVRRGKGYDLILKEIV